ncbi:protein FAM161B-like [Clytia hemisphaerica]|uniref:Protein FAM161A n=2 Tax=Clytia hemisphaerica TaxID=252671 RepID=A0A7M5X8E7_9CNID
MSSSHFISNFRNSCVIQPRSPSTRLPTTVLERDSLDFANRISSGIGRKTNPSTENVLNSYEATSSVLDQCKSPTGENSRNRLHQKSPTELKNLINDDDKFFSHLQALKKENKKTLNSLEKLYNMSIESNEDQTNTGRYIMNDEKVHSILARTKKHQESTKRRKPGTKQRSTHKDKSTDEKDELIDFEDQVLVDRLEKSFQDCREKFQRRASPPGTASAEENHQSLSQSDEELGVDIERIKQQKMDYYGKGSEGDEDEISSQSSEERDEDLDEQLRVTAPESHVNILPDKHERKSFRGRSSSFDVIAGMWENFSVDEYAPYTKRDKDADKKWSPSITIPEPFQMTIRDEIKARRKSKRIEQIEQEYFRKRLLEDMELQKRIRPTPVPPTTFLPLYDEHREKEEKRREYIRDLSKQILKSTEKPFSFVKREEVKHEMRKVHTSVAEMKKEKKMKEKQKFTANPYPEKLFGLTWADKLAEQDEYRKIKIKMRAQETLAQSSLPLSMKTRSHSAKYYGSREGTKRVKEDLKKRKQKFQPEIHHDIPDFEDLQNKFEEELHKRRSAKNRTICEPFDLQTGKIPERRSKFLNSVCKSNTSCNTSSGYSPKFERTGRSQSRNNLSTTGNRSRSLSWSRTQQQTPPEVSHTETSKLRHERLRKSLEKTKQEELQLAVKLKKKQQELNELRKSVTLKAKAQDPSRNRKKETKEKLKIFKMADHDRRKEYETYLQDVNEKLKDRPLLFERESQTNARSKAHKRYEEILREAGIDGGTLDSFLQGETTSGGMISTGEDNGVTDSEGEMDTVSNDGSYVGGDDSRRTESRLSDDESVDDEGAREYSEDEFEEDAD